MHDHEEQPELPKVRPVIGWPGGKTRMLKDILPLIPAHTLYAEVFGGGLAVFLAHPPSEVEVINDINGDLIRFYRCCKYHLEALLDELDLVMNSRQELRDFMEQRGLTDIQRGARWFIRNRISFGGMGSTFAVSRKHALNSRSKNMLAIRSLNRRLDRTAIENVPWEKCFDLYDSGETFWFLDPPYLDAGGEAYAGWSEMDLARFCARVTTLEGKWMVTFQDCPQIRAHFAGYQIKGIVRPNGIGNNGKKTKGRTYAEVIITSDRDEVALERKRRGA